MNSRIKENEQVMELLKAGKRAGWFEDDFESVAHVSGPEGMTCSDLHGRKISMENTSAQYDWVKSQALHYR
jgi:hypothetical protein